MPMVSNGKQQETFAKKIIYDFGANNGDDVPYYLKKADIVVCVEANPVLCEELNHRFSESIKEGRVFIENCVITDGSEGNEVLFYINKRAHVLSQFPKPEKNIDEFQAITLPSQSASEIVSKYGDPFYIKIDVEHYDAQILRSLFNNNIKPPYLSAESHSIDVFCLLVGLGNYSAFKIVDGPSVASKYKNHQIQTATGNETYSFPPHAAGPFGDEIFGNWLNEDALFRKLSVEGLGWKDIHATSTQRGEPSKIRLRQMIFLMLKKQAQRQLKIRIRKAIALSKKLFKREAKANCSI